MMSETHSSSAEGGIAIAITFPWKDVLRHSTSGKLHSRHEVKKRYLKLPELQDLLLY